MKITNKILIIGGTAALLAVILFGHNVRAATTIYSPPNYSSYTVGTSIGFYWYDTSDYYYISIWNEGWSDWQYLGNLTNYTNVTRTTEGWIGAQVASWENNQWEYSNVVWAWFYNPPPPTPPPDSPSLTSTPSGSAAKGSIVTFSWNQVGGNPSGYYILFNRDGVWDSSWTYNSLATSYDFNTTGLGSSIGAQAAACNSGGCSYSNIVSVSLYTPTPSQMNLTPLVSGNSYSESLAGPSDVKYAKVTNTSGIDQTYTIRLTVDTANTSIALVDGNGNPNTADTLSLGQGHMAFKVSTNGERYLKFTGTQAGDYTFVFNRFRLFPYLEAP